MSLEIILEHTVDNQALTFIDRLPINLFPQPRLEQDIAQRVFGTGNRATKAIQEPLKPARYGGGGRTLRKK